jgi:SRSO17 transposase
MLPEQIAGLAPALTEFLGSFRNCFGECRTVDHFATYCRGLLSNLGRKSVEPIAVSAGSTVRALQLFLTHRYWDHLRLRDRMAERIVRLHAPAPGTPRAGDDLGTIGLIDETSVAKKGDQTPGVQRQYCGAMGKLENCIVTVHLGYLHGDFKTLIDSDLFLPKGWAEDRDRCRDADIPDDLPYRPKTAIALGQVQRAIGNGLRLDWAVFDEGYGKDPAFWFGLDHLGQLGVGEVPSNFRCWPVLPKYHSQRKEFASRKVYNVVRWSPMFIYQNWRAIPFPRQTVEPVVWDIKAAQVYLVNDGHPTDRTYWLIVAWNRATGEYKYFVSNAPPHTDLELLLKVAFRRAEVEHLFRLAKGEAGLSHFEGRSYVGLMRHMILCQLVVLFLAEQAGRLNAEIAANAQLPADATRGKKIARQGPAENLKDSTLPQAGAANPGRLRSHPAAGHDGAARGVPELAVRPLA